MLMIPKNKLTLFLLFLPFILFGCGEESVGGSGQCGGVNVSGICLTITDIAPETTTAVDIVSSDCNDDPDITEAETLFEHQAVVTLSAAGQSGYSSPAGANFITITRYTVDYVLNPDYTYRTNPPSISSKGYNKTITIQKDGTATQTIFFMELTTKIQLFTTYTNSGWDYSEFPLYTATYTFYGTDDKNRDVEVRGSFPFSIGSYDNCQT